MAPNLHTESKNNSQCEEFVISGMSGKFPSCRNVKEFESNLYNKVNMVTDDESRWNHEDPKIPRLFGKIPEISKFDTTFFGINEHQAQYMDPQNRILLEESFKAISDAGVNPFSLRGSRTGVYIGACFCESEKKILYQDTGASGFGIVGCSRAMLANRISYTFGFTGPSLQCDSACSSSMTALNSAFHDFECGHIDAAIVGGSNLILHPNTTLNFALLGVLSPEGICRPFDANANGYVRSETIGCIFLQRRSHARRVYATIVKTGANCDGFKQEGITFPSGKVQEQLLSEVYKSINFDVNDLGFVEAHSTGTIVGDPEECNAIDKAICMKRKKTLLIGSVKSNMGHSEPASGLASIVKTLIAFKNNLIPPNLHMTSVRETISSLAEGRLTVVTEATPLQMPFVGLNSFGFGGANAHALFKRFDKEKKSNECLDLNLPRIVTWLSRTEKNANDFFDNLENQTLDDESLALIDGCQHGGIPQMLYRGYTVLKPNGQEKPIPLTREVQYFGGIRPPIVWVFSGMGSQWVGMGKSLMSIPLFKKTIQRCHNTLKPSGLDLIKIITSDDPKTFDNIVHSFVGIAAIQIGLVDILRTLEINPDFIIGHSVGELGCSYADDCFTLEQMILCAYYRGKVSYEMDKIKGSMAAVGLGYNDIIDMLPEPIEVACHNSSDSCTISGPYQEVEQFVKELQSKNIFARIVPSSNIAYHSRYISQFGPELLKYLKHIIPNPKPRSNKWISTSVPKKDWGNKKTLNSSAEYHTNNLLSSVLFEEASRFLPKNALTIEISPHGLLQSILKSANPQGTHIALTHRNAEDGVQFFLQSIGRLHTNGVNMSVRKLYPEVEWPVSRGTDSISHLIDFDHSNDYYVYSFRDEQAQSIAKTIHINAAESHKYITGHEIDGRILVPATFYLECVWAAYGAMLHATSFKSVSVEFEDVRFIRATTITPATSIALTVVVHRGTGIFEVTESQSLVVTGIIRKITSLTKPRPINTNTDEEVTSLIKKDFYKELKLRGYHYNGDFQGVQMSYSNGSYGKIKWIDNWVTFMDCMLQLSIVGHDSRNLMLPTKIRSLKIYTDYHQSIIDSEPSLEIPAYANKLQQRIVAGGIEINGMEANTVQRRRAPGDPVLEKYQFIPHFPAPKLSITDATRCCVQLVLETQGTSDLNVIEINNNNECPQFIINNLVKAIEELPLITGNYTVLHTCQMSSNVEINLPGITQVNRNDNKQELNGTIVIVDDLNKETEFLLATTASNGFVISKNEKGFNLDEFIPPHGLTTIAVFPTDVETLVLLRKTVSTPNVKDTEFIGILSSDHEFKWINRIQKCIELKKRIVLVTQNDKFNGILGLVNCLRKEPDTKHTSCVLINDPDASSFNVDTPLYAKQLSLGLPINIFQKGQWGSYRHLLLPTEYPLTTYSHQVYGNILHIGDLSTLKWLQGPTFKKREQYNFKIIYASLNFRDVMTATGRIPFAESRLSQNCVFGLEYSGIDLKTGKRVMGMAPMGAVASLRESSSDLVMEIPEHWSLREAATVPVVYITVYYAFFFTVDIRKGRSILIHAGSGGVGIAAIRVALSYGLDVFTTVSTAEKKAFLLKTFPTLKESHIGNSRDNSFENMIMDETNSKGVDFVLNSLSEEKLLTSIRCLAYKGHFLEIGKFDMSNDNKIGLGQFLKELSFHAVLADRLINEGREDVNKILELINRDIANGIVQPLPTTVYAAYDIEKAFRFLMSGKHIGKVMIQIHEDADSDSTMPITAIPKIYFNDDLVYIIPGGLGGFGLELIDWMALRGARKFVISSKRGITTDYQKFRIELWKSYSCQVVINTSDIGTYEGCLKLIEDSMKHGPIGGIFNLAVLLRDSLFSNQTVDLYKQSFEPKALATIYLDEISRKLCPNLHQFVVFSSVSCGRGNAGQTNYGMSNSVMERVIENRIAHGLPGKAIQWGAVGEVGLVAEMAEGKIDLEIGGTLQQRISSCLNVLDDLLASPDAIVGSMVVAEKKTDSTGLSPLEFVLNIMSIRDIKSVSMTSTLADLGMDSLMSVEIKQVLEHDYDIVLSSNDLRSLTLLKIDEYSASYGKSAKTQVCHESNVSSSEVIDNMKLLYGGLSVDMNPSIIFDHINDINEGDAIIIIPGIDGCSGEVWRNIGKELKCPAYVLQFHLGKTISTMDDTVQYGLKNILKLLQPRKQKKFRIIGYSLGALFAHILVSLLEKDGYEGSLLLIEGSPSWLNALMSMFNNIYKDIELYRNILATALQFYLPELDFAQIVSDMRDLFHIDVLVKYVFNTLQAHKSSNIENAMIIMESVLKKVQFVSDPEAYKFVNIINSPILLLKAKVETLKNFDENFGLLPFSRGSIESQVLDGNHQTILVNSILPDIINDFFLSD